MNLDNNLGLVKQSFLGSLLDQLLSNRHNHECGTISLEIPQDFYKLNKTIQGKNKSELKDSMLR